MLAKEYQAPVKKMPCEEQRHECFQCYKDNKHVSSPPSPFFLALPICLLGADCTDS